MPRTREHRQWSSRELRKTGVVPPLLEKPEESREVPEIGAWTAVWPQRRSVVVEGVRKRGAAELSERLEAVEGYTGILPVEEELDVCEWNASDTAGTPFEGVQY
ncbi:hypothetical protein NDU88_006547 [Pleurodeles waltl]|uniref:Uncharacterized protein n=1 Tax=Pleurodeles waltl TaxID=8319 RepID=A0AAV7X1L1_PLEWA|nr:hypothetical protein NDU88_006547 [Pleurodeles waltl]